MLFYKLHDTILFPYSIPVETIGGRSEQARVLTSGIESPR